MSLQATAILKNVWYYATPESHLVKNMKALEIAGEPIVVFKNEHGVISAVRNICPHRGIPLSYGQVVGADIECPYHGWTFNGQGRCTKIPSLCSGQEMDTQKIKIKSYPTRLVNGNIWVFLGEEEQISKAPPIPAMPFFPENKAPNFIEVAEFPCHIDHAVIGLMDPAHGPFVHKSWFWRSARSIHEKQKTFAPVSHGFQMVRHQPSKNSRAYQILGGKPSTEITFSLPSVRVEHVAVGKKSFCSYTALTPITENRTRIHQLAYWDMPTLTVLKPIVKKFTRVFLYQDLDAVTKQQEGLKYNPSLMLIKDADTQAKWYYSLKNEWQLSQTENREFKNPVSGTVLRWKS